MADTPREVFAKLSPTARAQHTAAWGRVEAHVRSLAKPGAKVFEVHHLVEHARREYQERMGRYLPADLCEKQVMGMYA